MNDLERLAAALREANAELDLQSPDLDAAIDSARRHLLWRLLLVGVLSALGATLLLTGGLAASGAVNPIGDGKGGGGDHGEKTTDGRREKGDGGDGKDGNGGDGGGKNGNGRGEGRERKDEHRDKPKEKVEPGKEVLPNLVVVSFTETEITVRNESSRQAGPFLVVVEAVAEGEILDREVLEFDELAGQGEETWKFEDFECTDEATAKVDPFTQVKESDEDDNFASASECKPPNHGEEEEEPEGVGEAGDSTTTGTGL